ncbi:hypothetical protein DTO282F9_8421 [Paecilomyces variotii]|nr:hypothetical protein DTO282E5_630 [Paecilomyces variotii]KAJ9394695.1 hypothetical protein DTO282F9_8421 [Paecilomyces variotii]
MNSRYTASNAGAEPPQSPYPVGLSPASAGAWNQPSRRRRDVVQPPALTTSFNGPLNPGLGVALNVGYTPTPLSTTSLSSPFSQSQSTYLPSPGGATRGSSPMAPRNLSSYTAPYNPREWGPVGSALSNAGSAAYSPDNGNRAPQPPPQQSASDVLPSPPPPYSPPAQRQPSRDLVNQTISPADSTSSGAGTSQYYTPTSATTAVSAETLSEPRRPGSRSRPLSMVQANNASSSMQMSFPPPPPGTPGPGPSSRPGSDRQRKGFNFPSFGLRSRLSSGPARTDVSQSPSPGPSYSTTGAPYADISLRPPSSKRAASTGAINSTPSSSRATSASRSGSPPGRSWEPGMPLPPPPPGPPPGRRSHSTGRTLNSQSKLPAHGSPSSWQSPVMGTRLGTVPPTPADWVDEDSAQNRTAANGGPSHIDVENDSRELNEPSSDGMGEPQESSTRPRRSSNGGLFRTPAVRDMSARGIRERRLESWHKRQQASEPSGAVSSNGNPWADAMPQVRPSNLVLSGAENREIHMESQQSIKSAPLSSTYSTGSEGAGDSSRTRMSSGLFSSRSSFSTPRQEQSSAVSHQDRFAHTPPFSPHGDLHSSMHPKGTGQAVPPKALPTPPPQSAHDTSATGLESRAEQRPVSHILHLPNEPAMIPQPLSPRRTSAEQPPSMDPILRRDDQFMRGAVQRHQSFIEKEAVASSESEALRLFTDYIVSESIIRSERYSTAWESANLDIQRVRETLFQPPAESATSHESSTARQSSTGNRPLRGESREIHIDTPQSRPESAWWANYQPCLSPIASLSMSNDEMSSRGRAPSRWWESKTGSSSEGGERKVQRSKRESKYMGLQRELREAMQWSNGQSVAEVQEEIGNINSSSQPVVYGPDEYPSEKVGWHEQPPQSHPDHSFGDPSEEDRKMDISRLITLPPPYPRHYPAVNNSHPDMVTYRTTVRSITDLSEIRTTRERHKAQMEKTRAEHQDKIQQNRLQFRSNVQNEIQRGNITFAEAAQAEATLANEEKLLEKEMIKNDFVSFQESVLRPMHTILTERINKATAGIEELRAKLSDAAQYGTPDQAQEEGDGKPELLEMLTQLKWLFEAREQLHREVYDLLCDRNEKYRDVVSLQYRQSNNEEKIRETDSFFIQDAMDRRVQYETDTLSRLESFMDIIEENVARGVEIQLSAFWDIAPSLLELLQKFPDDLQGLEIRIPASEYEESPSYHEHPLQYLYSLLTHAEKSTYQYIESQTNLLCLLHEVKSGVMGANCKLMEAQRIRHGEAEDVVRHEMRESRAQEERVLITDLKDKVSTVEGQWTEALGSQIQELRERVRDLLIAEGGWEEVEQLDGV